MTLLAVGLALVASVVALATAGAVRVEVKRQSEAQKTVLPAPYDDTDVRGTLEAVVDLTESLRADYGRWQEDINLAVAEGIKHVERAENRIKATIRRAREELEEGGIRSPGLEAEAAELFGVDGEGSRGGAMRPVPRGVDAGLADDYAAFPGTWLPEHVSALRS